VERSSPKGEKPQSSVDQVKTTILKKTAVRFYISEDEGVE
jgi:hypothetical protein